MTVAVSSSSSTTPSHKNGGKLISLVASYLQMDSTDGEVKTLTRESINSGIGLFNARRWHSQHATSDITTVAADDDYGLPADFKKPIACFRVNSSDERTQRIPYKPLKTLLLERPDNSTPGDPQHYGINYVSRELILEIQPSTAWVANVPELRLIYHRRIPEIVQDSTVIDVEPEVEWFLVWHGRREMASIREPGKFQLADRMANQYWRELIRDDTDQMTDWSEYR